MKEFSADCNCNNNNTVDYKFKETYFISNHFSSYMHLCNREESCFFRIFFIPNNNNVE